MYFLIKFIVQSSCKVTVKLSGEYGEFLYISHPKTHTASQPPTSPPRVVHLLELTNFHRHKKSKVYIRVHPFYFFKRFYLLIFRERGREGEREGEKHQCVVAPQMPPAGDPPATQACASTGNRTSNPPVCRLALSPLSHTSWGYIRLHSQYYKFYRPGQMYNDMFPLLQYHTELLHCSKNPLYFTCSSLPGPRPLASTDFFQCPHSFAFSGMSQSWKHIVCSFSDWLLSLSNMHLKVSPYLFRP